MNYKLVKDIVDLLQEFELENNETRKFTGDVEGFRKWLSAKTEADKVIDEPVWEDKESGRSAESIIATLFVHMSHYARNYFRSAIHGSDFSTPEEVIYLIVLRFSQPLTKMELIKKNVHDKPVGIQIINRLIQKGWIAQENSPHDKRSRLISVTSAGIEALEKLMVKVRQATAIVSGDLTAKEKNQLITLLNKLNEFHLPVYEKNYKTGELIDRVIHETNAN